MGPSCLSSYCYNRDLESHCYIDYGSHCYNSSPRYIFAFDNAVAFVNSLVAVLALSSLVCEGHLWKFSVFPTSINTHFQYYFKMHIAAPLFSLREQDILA